MTQRKMTHLLVELLLGVGSRISLDGLLHLADLLALGIGKRLEILPTHDDDSRKIDQKKSKKSKL